MRGIGRGERGNEKVKRGLCSREGRAGREEDRVRTVQLFIQNCLFYQVNIVYYSS